MLTLKKLFYRGGRMLLMLLNHVDDLMRGFNNNPASWNTVENVQLEDLEIGDTIRVRTASGNIYLLEVSCPEKRMAHLYRHDQRETALQGYRGQRVIMSLRVGREMFYTASSNPEDARDCRKVHRTRNVQSIHILTV